MSKPVMKIAHLSGPLDLLPRVDLRKVWSSLAREPGAKCALCRAKLNAARKPVRLLCFQHGTAATGGCISVCALCAACRKRVDQEGESAIEGLRADAAQVATLALAPHEGEG
jgi:hypothetical protein